MLQGLRILLSSNLSCLICSLWILRFRLWGDRDDRKSTSMYVFIIGSGAIYQASKKQPTISLSTTKVEYYAMSVVAHEAIWLRHILKEICYEKGGSSLISSNNQLIISLAKNPMFHQRKKHVEIHAHFIREKVLDGIIHLEYCPSTLKSTNFFTKPLP